MREETKIRLIGYSLLAVGILIYAHWLGLL